jgi:hypothetical protein
MSKTYIQATPVIQATALDQHAVCAAQHAAHPSLHPASFAVIQHATTVALSEQMRQTYNVHTIQAPIPKASNSNVLPRSGLNRSLATPTQTVNF